MRIICVNAALCNIFIKGRENAREMNAADSNDLNVYVRDVVDVFKPLLGLTPQRIFFYTTTTTSLRRCCAAIHTPLRLL